MSLNEWWLIEMIINKLNYKVYGKLIDVDLQLEKGLNVIFGENEAGKSTIFNSILSLIYGFKPTNREKHPYANWEKNEINFFSEIENFGELFGVERSLKSTPKFNLVDIGNNSVTNYRNEPLPMVPRVSDALFESVFHLTAENLNQIEKDSWSSIQEKLIFNYGTDYLNKASDVILQLEQEINALWRKDKRGNPQINQLQIEISELKLKRNEAEKYYERTRMLTDKLDDLNRQLVDCEQRKQSLESNLKNLRVWLPIKELNQRIKTLENAVFKPEQFQKLNPQILDQIVSLKNRIGETKSKLEALKTEREKCVSSLYVFSEQDIKLLDFRKESERLKVVLTDLLRLEQDEHTRLEELVKLREKIAIQYKLIFEGEITDTIKSDLKSILVLDLMSLIQKYAEGYEKNEVITQNRILKKGDSQKKNILIGILGIGTGLLGVIFEPLRALIFIGVACVTFAIARMDFNDKKNTGELFDLDGLRQKIDDVSKGLPMPEYVWRDKSLRFFNKLEQLISMIHDEEQLHDKWKVLISSQENGLIEIENVMKTSQLDTSRGAKLSLQFNLAQMEQLSNIEKEEVIKQVRIEAFDVQIGMSENELKNHSESLSVFTSAVENFGDGNYDFGLSKIEVNHDLIRKIKIYTDERALIDCDDEVLETVSTSRIEDVEKELVTINDTEKSILNEQNSIKIEISKYSDMLNLEDINSLILSHEDRLKELVELRNRKMILLEIIKFSDERFRLENQPNIITRVSYFMNRMTNGKYKEVLINEVDGNFELQFLIGSEIVPVTKAFSKGTLQQLFFAFRLAVIEALDPESTLPFVLDEAFVNFDIHRFEKTLYLLKDVSKDRQIVFFTCHQNLVTKISELVDANILEVT